MTIADLMPMLERYQVARVSLRRANGVSLAPRPEMLVQPEDTLVLSGRQLDLAEVEELLTR